MLSPRTREGYLDTLRLFTEWMESKKLPERLDDVETEHVERYLDGMVERGLKPSTVATRYRGLRQFWKWAAERDLTPKSPMNSIRKPKVPEHHPDVLEEEQIEALRAVTPNGRRSSFEDRRDRAIIELLLATGLRRSEIAAVKISDVNLDTRIITIPHGKGGKPRMVRFNDAAAEALDRYLFKRERHKYAKYPALWLGWGGSLAASGIRTVLRRRCLAAGVKAYAHLFRHTFAHRWLAAGGTLLGLQKQMGWSDATAVKMANRYGASKAQERALDEYDRLAM
jgi:site-specific recombinase XerD